jgi:DNA (cytosine-5)-methyltransferase 1
MTEGSRSYGVKLVRGPFLRLPPHPRSCETEEDLRKLCRQIRLDSPGRPLAADLFSGAGGLSLGLEEAGINVVFSVDIDQEAVETHRHHFAGMTVDWDLSAPTVVDNVANILKDNGVEILAGGPPCQPFSKAGRSLMRHQVRTGVRDAHDKRRDLWRSYLDIVRLARPTAVLMENVPDMALDREMFILRSMVLELERLGYGVQVRVFETWRYGVPQFRQRLMLVALAEGRKFEWPQPARIPTTLDDAISDLPPVEGGWRPEGGAEGWAEYSGPRSSYQQRMRRGVTSSDSHKVFDHITRPVREDDRAAFALMDTNTRYSDLPEEFKRYRDDIFDDKYKRLDGASFSRTITAHIAKDGYWYIHPRQDRTLTVREAARIQSFPDHFRFAGPPTAAFRQIGNAVPPLAGAALGASILEALEGEPNSVVRSEELSSALAQWFSTRTESPVPWLRAQSRWQVLVAERLLERASTSTTRSLWPHLEKHVSPSDTLEAADELLMIGSWAQRRDRAQSALDLALHLVETKREQLDDATLSDLVSEKLVTKAHADMAALVHGADHVDASEEPVITTKGVLRVVARYLGEPVDLKNRQTDGRIAIARIVGFGPSARSAHLALMDIANSICQSDPLCESCPLRHSCHFQSSEDRPATLDLTFHPGEKPNARLTSGERA